MCETECTCDQIEVTAWPGPPVFEREFIRGKTTPGCPIHDVQGVSSADHHA